MEVGAGDPAGRGAAGAQDSGEGQAARPGCRYPGASASFVPGDPGVRLGVGVWPSCLGASEPGAVLAPWGSAGLPWAGVRRAAAPGRPWGAGIAAASSPRWRLHPVFLVMLTPFPPSSDPRPPSLAGPPPLSPALLETWNRAQGFWLLQVVVGSPPPGRGGAPSSCGFSHKCGLSPLPLSRGAWAGGARLPRFRAAAGASPYPQWKLPDWGGQHPHIVYVVISLRNLAFGT